MKGVIVEKAGGELKLVNDVEKPKPGPDQLLAKSIYSSLQPMYVDYPPHMSLLTPA